LERGKERGSENTPKGLLSAPGNNHFANAPLPPKKEAISLRQHGMTKRQKKTDVAMPAIKQFTAIS
jgi:hypothetical protein